MVSLVVFILCDSLRQFKVNVVGESVVISALLPEHRGVILSSFFVGSSAILSVGPCRVPQSLNDPLPVGAAEGVGVRVVFHDLNIAQKATEVKGANRPTGYG